ncbi:hypothetical protein J2W51_003919 [Tardiphaga robiniae]|uniref:hypothetical protein n=1 Tax=Tardiphaga robiniae TaxID=943830 RepID=UPI002856FD4A|nr:hypothetical protein [Tardiphaga robiniae]MDR6661333.1 hypothetical protein [Tardiphaga robiniae]
MIDWTKIGTALRKLLDRDRASNRIVVHRNQSINRNHYAKMLGIDRTSLVRRCCLIFTEYEAGNVRVSDELRAPLDRDISAGKLKVSPKGKKSRARHARILTVSPVIGGALLKPKFASYDSPSIGRDDRLRDMLDRDRNSGHLVTRADGSINRKHYAKALGISVGYLRRRCENILRDYKSDVLAVSDRLGSLLSRDLAAGVIIKSHDGKVNRAHYARELGVHRNSLMRSCGNIMEEYDELPQDVATKLRSLLERDRCTGGIVRGRPFEISRGHYAEIIGVSSALIRVRCREVFKEYEANWGATHEQLRNLLQHDFVERKLVSSRNGLINRAHYAKKIGVSPSLFKHNYKATFTEYEARCKIETGPLAKLEAIRAYLEEAYESGSLEFRDRKVDRKACCMAMGWPGGSALTRHREIRNVFESYDRRALAEGYLPLNKRHALDKVNVWLRRPVLNKDLLKVNRKSLLAELKMEPRFLYEPRIKEAIALKEASLFRLSQKSESDPYVNRRVFRFSRLVPLWSSAFIKAVGSRFKVVMSGAAHPRGPYRVLHRALDWIANSFGPMCQTVVVEAKKNGVILSGHAWNEALNSFCTSVEDEAGGDPAARNTARTEINSLNAALRALSSGGVVPELERSLRINSARGPRGEAHYRSVAELIPKNSEGAVEAYIEFAKIRFQEACRLVRSESHKSESEAFIITIGNELKRDTSLPDTASKAVLAILEKRISALTARANEIVEEARRKLKQGQKLIAKADIDALEFERMIFAQEPNSDARAEVVREYFAYPADESPAARERSIANLLKLVRDRLGGKFPTNKGVPKYGTFFEQRCKELGGLRELEGFLMPTPATCGAVLTLYLAESGANVSVGRTLDRDCVQASDQSGYARITGHKARAKGKPIFVDLPDDNQAVRALRWLKAAMDPFVSWAGDDGDRLFLLRMGAAIHLMSSTWYAEWFKRFACQALGLPGFVIVPSMIRPSVLLRAALANDGRLQVGLAIAQHGLAVTQGYQNKWPTRLLYDEKVRNFQNDFQTLIVGGIPEAAMRLGVPEGEMRARLDRVAPTGLGTFCLSLQNAAGPNGRLCKTMSCWDGCPHMLIVAEVEAIATLQLWQASLREAAPDWERDRPERWEQVWLPWLCLVDVVQEKMTRGPLLKIWKAANVRMNELRQSAGFIPHAPW